MRLDSLEQIKKKQNKRKRVIRARTRAERLKKVVFKQEYSRAFTKAKKDYEHAHKEFERFKASNDPHQKINATNDQKFLLSLFMLSGKSSKKHNNQKINPVFILHLYTLCLAELNQRKSRIAQALVGYHSLDALEAIRTWSDLQKRIQQVESEKSEVLNDALSDVQKQKESGTNVKKIEDEIVILKTQISEVQSMLAQSPQFVHENAAFLYHLMLRIALTAIMLPLSFMAAGAVVMASASAMIVLGSTIITEAASFYMLIKDYNEYNERWDDDFSGYRDAFGDVLGTTLILMEVLSIGHGSAKHGLKATSKYTNFSKSTQKKLDQIFDFKPAGKKSALASEQTAEAIDTANRYRYSLKALKHFFEETVPPLCKIAALNPNAGTEVLVRGILSSGVDLGRVFSAVEKNPYFHGAASLVHTWEAVTSAQALSNGGK